MEQPEGFEIPGKEHLVCKLNRSLYGQSPRCWNKVFTEFMESVNFKQSTADPCIFIRKSDTLDIVAVCVDDLILITETEESLMEIKQELARRFDMKDLGKLHYILGLHVDQMP